MKTSIKQKNSKLMVITAGILVLSTSYDISAGTIVGGTLQIDFDVSEYAGFFGNTLEFNNLANGAAVVTHPGPFTSGPNETATYDINDGTPINNAPLDPATGGRGRLPSDFTYSDISSTLADLESATGKIGLTGLAVSNNSVAVGDLTLDPADLDAGAGTWLTRNNLDFAGFDAYELNISSFIVNGDEFILTGDVLLSPTLSFLFPSAGPGADIGNFTLTATTVPVPAAVWMFGSGILGLIAAGRKKAKIF